MFSPPPSAHNAIAPAMLAMLAGRMLVLFVLVPVGLSEVRPHRLVRRDSHEAAQTSAGAGGGSACARAGANFRARNSLHEVGSADISRLVPKAKVLIRF